MEQLIYSALCILLGGFIGYLSGYMKRKGENVATHEDFQTMLAELKESTHATKQIEAKISDAVWDRQKRWELKREVLFEASRKVAEVNDVLATLVAIAQLSDGGKDKQWESDWMDAMTKWSTVDTSFREIRTLIRVVCMSETIAAFEAFGELAGELGGKAINKEHEAYSQSTNRLNVLRVAASSSVRKELGIDSSTVRDSIEPSASQDF